MSLSHNPQTSKLVRKIDIRCDVYEDSCEYLSHKIMTNFVIGILKVLMKKYII